MSIPSVTRIDELIELIESHRSRGDPARRVMVAIAGPPGVGKSTVAEQLNKRVPDSCVVPMDGFHLDNALLKQQGLMATKGAPNTFDVDGFRVLLQRLAADDGPVHIPVFDRDADLSRAAARTVTPDDRVMLIEGNYLLLAEAPWSSLAGVFDLSLALTVPRELLERRLVDRWLEQGMDPDAARERAMQNDIPNGERVLAGSCQPDVYFVPVRQLT